MNYDPHKDMNIRYNHLNLSEFIEFPDCKAIEYTYDAGGLKLKKTTKSGNTVISTQDYTGGIEYKNGVIEAIYNSDGRLYFENNTSRYEYNIANHLGNSRVCFTDKDGNGVIDITGNPETNEVLEESHFYPFGMQMQGSFTENAGRENNYLYNGKELDTDFGLNWYHYRARMYDPAIGRFPSIDPKSESFAFQSPYVYAANDPIKNIDKNGENPIIGAIVGAGLDVAAQVFIEGKSLSELDGKSVLISAAAGATGVGLVGKANKLFKNRKLIAKGAEVLIDGAVNAGQQLANTGEIDGLEVAAAVTIGQAIRSPVRDKIKSSAAGKSKELAKSANKAKNQATNRANRLSKGKGRASKAQKFNETAEKSAKRLSNHTRNVNAVAAGSGVTGSGGTSKIIKAIRKDGENE